MTAPELKPCPFCGGGAEDDYMHDDDQCGGHGAVYCVEGCGAEVYGDTVRYRGQEPTKEAMQASKQSAIAAWNTRTPDPLLAEMAEALREAKDAMEAAHASMFRQCLSNPVKNAWGKQVDLTEVNKLDGAAYRARAVLAKMEGR